MVMPNLTVFTGARDAICPLNVDGFKKLFNSGDGPDVITYKDWTHNDFVTGASLEKLVADIVSATDR